LENSDREFNARASSLADGLTKKDRGGVGRIGFHPKGGEAEQEFDGFTCAANLSDELRFYRIFD
jgi:hypothetical protein